MQPKHSGNTSHTKQGSAETQTQPQDTTAAAPLAQGPPLVMATSIEDSAGSTSPVKAGGTSNNEASATASNTLMTRTEQEAATDAIDSGSVASPGAAKIEVKGGGNRAKHGSASASVPGGECKGSRSGAHNQTSADCSFSHAQMSHDAPLSTGTYPSDKPKPTVQEGSDGGVCIGPMSGGDVDGG